MTRGGLLILATLFIAACGEKPVEKKGAPPTLITTTLVRQTSLEISERTLGTLTAVKDPMISAEVPGKIIKIAVRTGEPVKKGQLLARIDPSDVECCPRRRGPHRKPPRPAPTRRWPAK